MTTALIVGLLAASALIAVFVLIAYLYDVCSGNKDSQ